MKDPESLLLRDIDKRTQEFSPDRALEFLLEELEAALAPVDVRLREQFTVPRLPPLFLLGSPRSGTSLLMQLFALSGDFAVPTNLMARFSYAPYIGAKIQQLLCDPRFDKNGELGGGRTGVDLSSRLGKTAGVLAPNEFYHFWRRYIPSYDVQHLCESQLQAADTGALLSSIAAIESVSGRPFASKAMMIQYNLEFFAKAMPEPLYVHIRRRPDFVMQSILSARESFYGDRERWWSVKPKEFAEISEMDVPHQVAGQVFFTTRAIERGLATIPESHIFNIDYEELCRSPAGVYANLVRKYAELGVELPGVYAGPAFLESGNVRKVDERTFDLLSTAYDEFAGA